MLCLTGRLRVVAGFLLLGCLGGVAAPSTAEQSGPARAERRSTECDAVPQRLRLTSDDVLPGGSVVAKVRLSCARRHRSVLAIATSPGAKAPAFVVVRAGRRAASFMLSATSDEGPRTEQVTVGRHGRTAAAQLRVEAGPPDVPGATSTEAACPTPHPESLSVPEPLHAGDHATASVTLTCAPATATVVSLTTGWELNPPPVVTVPAGTRTASFPMDVYGDGPRHTTFIAAWLNNVRVVRNDVTIDPGLSYLGVTPWYGPWSEPRTLALELNAPAPPEGTLVHITTSDPSVVPSFDVVIPPGSEAITESLEVHDPVADEDVTVFATLGPRSISTEVRVWARPPIPGDLGIGQVDPQGPVTSNFAYARMWVKIDAPAPSGSLTVHLTSDHPEAFPPLDVLIYAGDTWSTFDWLVGPVDEPTLVTIAGTVEGYPGLTGSFQVLVRPGVASIEMPDPIVSGVPFTATVHMAGPADAERNVYLNASWPVSCEQSTSWMPAGATSITAACVAEAVSEPQDVWFAVRVDHQENFQRRYPLVPAPGPKATT